MHNAPRWFANQLMLAGLCACVLALPSEGQVSVRSVKVLGSKDRVEIEVESSDRIVPQTQILTGPDRLVIDFPNAVPGNQLRSQSVDRGEVKDVRVGLFQAKPPVTRVVLDLKAAQSYQVFPSGRTVMIKVMGDGVASSTPAGEVAPLASHAGLVVANYTTGAEPVQISSIAQPALRVTYHDGLLGIHSNKATLSEVLYAVQQKTGADISIAAGAEQEKVVAEIEPAPAAEVLARLLNGSRFNFLIMNSASDPLQLDRVILSTRAEGMSFLPPMQARNQEPADDDGTSVAQANNPAPPAQNPPRQEPEARTPPEASTPEQ